MWWLEEVDCDQRMGFSGYAEIDYDYHRTFRNMRRYMQIAIPAASCMQALAEIDYDLAPIVTSVK